MKFLILALVITLNVVALTNGMGLCFGGGYPQCCYDGKNSCGPLCASCSRVGEYLHNMMMFMVHMGHNMNENVFKVTNHNPFLQGQVPVIPQANHAMVGFNMFGAPGLRKP